MKRRVLITREAAKCVELEKLVAPCGIVIEPYPVLRFEPVESMQDWTRVTGEIVMAREAGVRTMLVLASPRAAAPFKDQAERHGGHVLSGLPAAAVGRTTAREAGKYGIRVELTGPGTGAGLASELVTHLEEPALLVFACGAEHRPELPQALRDAGHTVLLLTVYRMLRLPPVPLPVPVEDLSAVVLTSPRSGRYYVENLGGNLPDCLHIALGPTTRDAVSALGITCRIPARPEMEALAEELCSI